jgi:endonuclease G
MVKMTHKHGWLLFLVLFTHQAFPWWPEDSNPTETIQHSAITIGYQEAHEVPQWVAYILRQEHLMDCYDRTDKFREDFSVSTGSAGPNDYRSSGYDRGHIAPAGDMKFSRQAMEESFFMSNITPQSPGMNRGQWAKLELLVRAWAKEGDETYIVSGPVLSDDLPKIRNTDISIPREHFKVVMRSHDGKRRAIAFLMAQNPAASDLRTYALSVRDVEKISGLNFFPHLNQTEQDEIEQSIDWSKWNFAARFSYLPCSN